MTTLSFLGMVNIAIRLVTDAYKGAELYEADGVATSGSTTEATGIDKMRVVFNVPADGSSINTTAIIESTTGGEFGKIQHIDQPWLEDRVIPWPVEMDLPKAVELLQAAGHTQPFKNVVLRWPLGPSFDEVYYIFGMLDGRYIFVGTQTGTVSAFVGTQTGTLSAEQ